MLPPKFTSPDRRVIHWDKMTYPDLLAAYKLLVLHGWDTMQTPAGDNYLEQCKSAIVAHEGSIKTLPVIYELTEFGQRLLKWKR